MRCLPIAHAGIFTLLLLAGCVTAPTVERKTEGLSEPMEKQAEKSVASPLIVQDFDLLHEGIALLGRPDRSDPTKARSVFASLLQHYPKSRWRSAAETFIRLIDETEASREKSRHDHLLLDKAQEERAKALRENDHLRKTIRDLTEKHQAEKTVLTQENELLKNDLQRLKALEIELQKRERMLR